MDRELTFEVKYELLKHVRDHTYKPEYCKILEHKYIGTDDMGESVDKYIITVKLEVYVAYGKKGKITIK